MILITQGEDNITPPRYWKVLQAMRGKDIERVLGVTDVDLYVPELNFVFGEADIPLRSNSHICYKTAAGVLRATSKQRAPDREVRKRGNS